MNVKKYLIGALGGLGLGAIIAAADVDEAYAQGLKDDGSTTAAVQKGRLVIDCKPRESYKVNSDKGSLPGRCIPVKGNTKMGENHLCGTDNEVEIGEGDDKKKVNLKSKRCMHNDVVKSWGLTSFKGPSYTDKPEEMCPPQYVCADPASLKANKQQLDTLCTALGGIWKDLMCYDLPQTPKELTDFEEFASHMDKEQCRDEYNKFKGLVHKVRQTYKALDKAEGAVKKAQDGLAKLVDPSKKIQKRSLGAFLKGFPLSEKKARKSRDKAVKQEKTAVKAYNAAKKEANAYRTEINVDKCLTEEGKRWLKKSQDYTDRKVDDLRRKLTTDSGLELSIGAMYLNTDGDSETGFAGHLGGGKITLSYHLNDDMYLMVPLMVYGGGNDKDHDKTKPATKGQDTSLSVEETRNEALNVIGFGTGLGVGHRSLFYDGDNLKVGLEGTLGGMLDINLYDTEQSARFLCNGKPCQLDQGLNGVKMGETREGRDNEVNGYVFGEVGLPITLGDNKVRITPAYIFRAGEGGLGHGASLNLSVPLK